MFYDCGVSTVIPHCTAYTLLRTDQNISISYHFEMVDFDKRDDIEEAIQKTLVSWVDGTVISPDCKIH